MPYMDAEGRLISMAEVGPEDRVLSGGRADLLAYREKIVASTAEDHGLAAERALGEACRLQRRHIIRTAHCASLDIPPARLRTHAPWAATEGAASGGIQVLAALFGVLYPKPGRHLPTWEIQQLIARRLGPQCTGWTDPYGKLQHSQLYPCPVHIEPPASSM